MADTTDVPVSPQKKVSKPKVPAAHPKYSEMVKTAVGELKERGGSSRQAILRYIMNHFNVGKDEKTVNQHLKMSLRASVKNELLKQSKGSGASGSFRLGEKAKQADKPKKVKKPKSVAKPKTEKSKKTTTTKKPKTPKKAVSGDAKPTKKVAKTKKESVKKVSPKKATKSPAKPKKAPTKAKKPATKKTTKKPATKETTKK